MAKFSSKEVIAAINDIAAEKGIETEVIKNFLIEIIKKMHAKKYDGKKLVLEIDLEKQKFRSELEYDVVGDYDNDYDDFNQIPISEVQKESTRKTLKVGDKFYRQINISDEFKANEVLQILQSLRQKITEVVNQKIYNSWLPKLNHIVYAELENEDKKNGALYATITGVPGSIDTTGYIPSREQSPREKLILGQKYPFIVKEVIERSKFWPVVLSRTSEEIVKYYLQLQIPEIEQELIKITKIARHAGIKTKILVKSRSQSIIEPVAICVGNKGQRIKEISNLIGGEKIEILQDYDDQLQNLIALIGREYIIGVYLEYDETKTKIINSIVIAKDSEVSQILGKSGINVKLINKLLNFPIDIKTLEYAQSNNIDFIKIEEIPTIDKQETKPLEIQDVMDKIQNEPNTFIENEDVNMDELLENEPIDDDDFVNDYFNDDISKILEDEKK